MSGPTAARRAAAPAALEVCNACGGTLEPRFPQVMDPQTRERFAIVACTACGLGHTSPPPEDLSPYYPQRYHGGRHGLTADYCVWRRTRFVRQVWGEKVGRVLDIGCGDGTFLLAMKRQGWQVAGTEMQPESPRSVGLEVHGSVGETTGAFDLVTSWHSLEHMRDPASVVRECAAALKPGGTLIVAVPNAQGAQARLWGARWVHLDVPRHLFHFGAKSLRRLIESTGLTAVRQWHHELEMDLFGWTQSALNLVMRDPNVLFDVLTGRETAGGRAQIAASFALGGVFTAAALPAFGASSALRQGGTIVVAARKPL